MVCQVRAWKRERGRERSVPASLRLSLPRVFHGSLSPLPVPLWLQLVLITAVVSGANLAGVDLTALPITQTPEVSPGSKAVTWFSSLLLLALISFTTFITMYRDTLLPAGSMASTDTALPPPSFGGPSGYEANPGSYGDAVSVQPIPPPPGGGGVL